MCTFCDSTIIIFQEISKLISFNFSLNLLPIEFRTVSLSLSLFLIQFNFFRLENFKKIFDEVNHIFPRFLFFRDSQFFSRKIIIWEWTSAKNSFWLFDWHSQSLSFSVSLSLSEVFLSVCLSLGTLITVCTHVLLLST